MLTKITVYSQWTTIDPLVLNVINKPETDLFEVRNTDGLGDVVSDVNTTKLGPIAGESFIGTNKGKRNIVLTLGLTPDWIDWTVSKLRQHLSKYFTTGQKIRMIFETTDFSPVEIFGYIESNNSNMFSKDSEQVISIVCPQLYFKSVDPIVIDGQTDQDPISIEYQGTVETGFLVSIDGINNLASPDWVKIEVNDPLENSLTIVGSSLIDATLTVVTVPGEKEITRILDDGTVENWLYATTILDLNDRERRWPMLGPGTIDFAVTSEESLYAWTLSYYNLFGSL